VTLFHTFRNRRRDQSSKVVTKAIDAPCSLGHTQGVSREKVSVLRGDRIGQSENYVHMKMCLTLKCFQDTAE
jgi:hypothetical protein